MGLILRIYIVRVHLIVEEVFSCSVSDDYLFSWFGGPVGGGGPFLSKKIKKVETERHPRGFPEKKKERKKEDWGN